MTSPNAENPHQTIPDEVRRDIFVVIAAYNEEGAIDDVVRGVTAHYPNVVVVDDGSRDRTFAAARPAAAHVLRHPVNRGQGAALQTGIAFALKRGAKYIVTFDADGQHRVEDIAPMVAPIIAGECDITLGSRFLGETINMPRSRRLTLQLGKLFTRFVSQVNLTDAHNGFRAFSRRAAHKIDIKLDRMAHASEIIDIVQSSGLPFREVPVEIRYTDYSLAKGQTAGSAFRIVIQYLLGRVLQ